MRCNRTYSRRQRPNKITQRSSFLSETQKCHQRRRSCTWIFNQIRGPYSRQSVGQESRSTRYDLQAALSTHGAYVGRQFQIHFDSNDWVIYFDTIPQECFKRVIHIRDKAVKLHEYNSCSYVFVATQKSGRSTVKKKAEYHSCCGCDEGHRTWGNSERHTDIANELDLTHYPCGIHCRRRRKDRFLKAIYLR